MTSVKIDIKDFAKAAKIMKEDPSKVIRASLLKMSGNIIKRTPVGNPDLWKSKPPPGYVGGSLRGAWNMSLQTPDKTINNNHRDRSGSQTISDASRVMKSYNPYKDTLFFVNPLPYAIPVEFGWSTQTPPQGMLRGPVLRLNSYVKRAISELS